MNWQLVCRVLEALEPERTPERLLGVFVEQIESIIPYDHAVAGISDTHATPEGPYLSIADHHWFQVRFQDPEFWRSYLGERRARDGLICSDPAKGLFAALPRVYMMDWAHVAASSDTADLLRKHHTRYDLSIMNHADATGDGFWLGFFRGSRKPFSKLDTDTLRALYPHLHNLFAAVIDPRGAAGRRTRECAAAAGLSRREQDVALLLADGLSIGEMAERLFISRHTVEKHLEHIYLKLRADGRSMARRLLRGEPPSVPGQNIPLRITPAARAPR